MRLAVASLCTALLTLSCCAHYEPASRITSIGFYAVQPMPTRQVYCYLNKDFSEFECALWLPGAIRALNEAAGHELLHFAGYASTETAQTLYEQGNLVIAVTRNLPDEVLGVTVPEISSTHFIMCVFIMLNGNRTRERHGVYDFEQVLLHELVHSVGGEHTDYTESRMRPNEHPGQKGLSDADARSLRAVYGD